MVKTDEVMPERHGHVVLDIESRRRKALKIEALLGLESVPGPIKVLEVGTGSGGIASYFGSHASGKFEVHSVDVTDSRVVRDGFEFSLVHDTALPFSDATFDFVLSNHVIEHVGDSRDQQHHLFELHRVLKPGGCGYLAVPSRWMLVEPHYKLAFLSWLPESLRTPYLRLSGKGDYYDCRPLTDSRAQKMCRDAGFECDQKCGSALLLTYEIERPDSLLYRLALKRIPALVYRLLGPIFPTLIYVLRPTDCSSAKDPLP